MPKYIDRDKIMLAGVPVSRDEDGECYVRLSDVRRAIMQVPVEDVQEVRHGNWEKQLKPYEDEMICSSCGADFNVLDNCVERFDYCPCCGAEMGNIIIRKPY